MTKRPNVSSMVVDNYNDTPLPKIVGMITVSSRNEHGFFMTTEHFDEASAARERVQRERQGHTEIS